jgi:hypothetical protein
MEWERIFSKPDASCGAHIPKYVRNSYNSMAKS